MKLTGKCKKDFEKWYFSYKYHLNGLHKTDVNYFYSLPQSMQYGVYVDYFDSVGITIHSLKPTRSGEWEVFVNGFCIIEETRQEARTKAIEKANEIRNKNLTRIN